MKICALHIPITPYSNTVFSLLWTTFARCKMEKGLQEFCLIAGNKAKNWRGDQRQFDTGPHDLQPPLLWLWINSPMLRDYHNPQNRPFSRDLKGLCRPFPARCVAQMEHWSRTAVKMFKITSYLSTPLFLLPIPTPKPTCSCSAFGLIR